MMIRFLPVLAFALLAPLAAQASNSVSKSYGMDGLEEKQEQEEEEATPPPAPGKIREIPLPTKPPSPPAQPPAPKPEEANKPAEEAPVSPAPAEPQPGTIRDDEESLPSPAFEPVSSPSVPLPPAKPAVPLPPAKPFVETAARPGATPKYVRINIKGYHVRSSPDFDLNDLSNVDFRTEKGALFPVRRTVRLRTGTAVNVVVNGKDRWIFVPDRRRSEFQFCESEACFADLAEALKILENQGVSQADLAACGIDLGTVADAALPKRVADVPLPTPRPDREMNALAASLRPSSSSGFQAPANVPLPPARPKDVPAARPASPAAGRLPPAQLQMKPLWEDVSARYGRRWTELFFDSLRRHGGDMMKPSALERRKAAAWCPRFSRLTDFERAEFYLHLMGGVAKRESGYNPVATFNERTLVTITGQRRSVDPRNFSQGFFQLSYDSAGQSAYRGFCKFDWAGDRGKLVSDSSLSIYDVKKQMDCAVGIMNYWVKKQGAIGGGPVAYKWVTNRNGRRQRIGIYEGGANFWSTLRDENPASREIKARLRRFQPCW